MKEKKPRPFRAKDFIRGQKVETVNGEVTALQLKGEFLTVLTANGKLADVHMSNVIRVQA